MIRNVILPLLLIALAGWTLIYCWYESAPISYIGIPAFLTIALGSLYPCYYIGYALFPDKRNKPLPPLLYLMDLKNEKQTGDWTKGGMVGLFLTLACYVGAWLTVPKLVDQYKEYHLHQYGHYTKVVVTGTGRAKGMGEYAAYEYIAPDGKTYSDRTARGILVVGDTLTVIYSTKQPAINEVIKTVQ